MVTVDILDELDCNESNKELILLAVSPILTVLTCEFAKVETTELAVTPETFSV